MILGFGSWSWALDFDWLEWKDHHPNTGPRRTARDGRGGGGKATAPYFVEGDRGDRGDGENRGRGTKHETDRLDSSLGSDWARNLGNFPKVPTLRVARTPAVRIVQIGAVTYRLNSLCGCSGRPLRFLSQ